MWASRWCGRVWRTGEALKRSFIGAVSERRFGLEAETICCLTASQEVQGTSRNYEKDTFEVVEAHGEDGPSSLKSLNLGFLIDREHDGLVRGLR